MSQRTLLGTQVQIYGWNLGHVGNLASSLNLSKSYAPLIVEKVYIWHYHQHNLFSFDWMILEFADNVDMDEVFDEFENWPDEVICSPAGSTRRTIVVNPVICVPFPVTLSNAYISTVIYIWTWVPGRVLWDPKRTHPWVHALGWDLGSKFWTPLLCYKIYAFALNFFKCLYM